MKKLKIGVFGCGGRGSDLAANFAKLGCEIVAILESNETRKKWAIDDIKALGFDNAVCYDDFDSFINHEGLDIVILANYFHDHAKYAIKCFERGIHVYSECTSNGTMAEGVALVRAFEKSSSIYMLAENYPQMKFNREIKRVCDGGTLGKFLYAEGEYNHPVSDYDIGFKQIYNYDPKHWRNYIPRTYYITHSLGPIMWATGAIPKTVTAFSSFAPPAADAPTTDNNGDRVAIITTKNDDESIFRVIGWGGLGAHHNSYRVCGTEGQIENLRGMGDKVMLRYNDWSIPEGMEEINCYEPEWNDKDEELIVQSGHGGGDYLTARMFIECIEKGKQPEAPFDVYSATVMASVAILGHRSVLEGGKPYEVPDFRCEEWRVKYENDTASPFPGLEDGSAPTVPCCSHTDYKASEEQIKNYRDALEAYTS